MIDVRDLGAKGDGIADDTAAIQLAIDNAKEILIPIGTYLISNSLTLKSDITIMGNGTIKVNSDGVAFAGIKAFTSGTAGIQNVQIIGITIDGGGQVGGVITAGKRSAIGIYLTNCTNIIIDKVHIKNCGVINGAAPQTDSLYGGFGILAQCNNGQIKGIKITNCTVEKIAGGGFNFGDGIYIGGSSSTGITPEDILISNCTITIVGRHGIGLAEAPSTSQSKNVRLLNNYISYTMLAGIDIEDGSDMIIADCQFSNCGNFTTSGNYYVYPPGTFPVTFSLRTAIATGTASNNITIADCIIDTCNIGIAYGAMLNKILNVYISNSNTYDINQSATGNGGDLIISNCHFATNKDAMTYYSGSNSIKLTNCLFEGPVVINVLKKGAFSQCTFKNGIKFKQPTSSDITWDDCDFLGSGTGTGIDITVINLFIKNCIVTNCRFSNLDSGIVAANESIIGWQINGNVFTNIATYGIRHINAGGTMAFRSIINNQFINTTTPSSTAISINQALPKVNISNNYFEVIATCISITGIFSGLDLLDIKIGDNLAIGCTNGLSIVLSTGNWNRCIITYNNFFGCSGTKLSVPGAGNAAGFVSNNIV